MSSSGKGKMKDKLKVAGAAALAVTKFVTSPIAPSSTEQMAVKQGLEIAQRDKQRRLEETKRDSEKKEDSWDIFKI